MNYQSHYDLLMDRARCRVLNGYRERHHVLPRCLGGSNDASNKVYLTPEEHYVAHQLLVQMHPSNGSLIWAASCMTGKNKLHARKNKLYGWLRRRLSEHMREVAKKRIYSPETLAKMSAAKLGVKRDKYVKHQQAGDHGLKGKPKSAEHIEAMSKARTGVKRAPFSEAHKRNMSKAIGAAMKKLGRLSYFDDEQYKRKQSESMKAIWKQRKSGERLLPVQTSDRL